MSQGTIIGYRKNGAPIWLVQGGSQDPADATGDGDGDADPAGDGDSDPAADDASAGDGPSGDEPDDGDASDGGSGDEPPQPKTKQPPAAPDPTANLKKALAAERAARKKADKDLQELRRQHASTEERALLEARETAAAEREAEVKPPLIKALAAAELRAAGVQGNGAQRLVGLLDLNQVDVDEDGALVGLDDQVTALKEEFPNLFEAPQPNGGRRAPRVNAGASGRSQDKGGNQEPKPWYEQLAEQVLQPGAPPGVGRR